jgi:hypothetical protein
MKTLLLAAVLLVPIWAKASPSITTAGTKDNDRVVTGYTVWASGSGFSTSCKVNVRKADLTLIETHNPGAAGDICSDAHYMRWALTTSERTAIDTGGVIIDVVNPDNTWARSALIRRPGASGGTVGVVLVTDLVRRYAINSGYRPCAGYTGSMFADGPITPYSYSDAGGVHIVINASVGDTNYGIAGNSQFANFAPQCPPSYIAEQRYGNVNAFAWSEWSYGFSRDADTGSVYTVVYNEYNGLPPCSQQGDGTPGCEQYMALGLAVKNPPSDHFVKVANWPNHDRLIRCIRRM